MKTRQKQRSVTASDSAGRGKSIVVCGAGNIGGFALNLLGRNPDVGRITIIDGDKYDRSNLRSQNIRLTDVGKHKVDVQARYLRQANPNLEVRAIAQWVENVPRGLLRSDVIVGCLDSRLARQVINEIAWRMGIPWIDSGVDGPGLLARVNVYMPGRDAPCGECSWGHDDYAAIEQTFGCQLSNESEGGAGNGNEDARGNGRGGATNSGAENEKRVGPPPTNAPASQGAIAAGLIATECQKLLQGDFDHLARHKQVLLDCRHYKCLVTRYTINSSCRFDHTVWSPVLLRCTPSGVDVAGFFSWVGHHVKGDGPPESGEVVTDEGGQASVPEDGDRSLQVGLAGHRFIRRLRCSNCDAERKGVWLDRNLPPSRLRCKCGQMMSATGFDMVDWLTADMLTNAQLRKSMFGVGFREGDIVTVRTPGGDQHVEFALSDQMVPVCGTSHQGSVEDV